jgi:hypothetical protein
MNAKPANRRDIAALCSLFIMKRKERSEIPHLIQTTGTEHEILLVSELNKQIISVYIFVLFVS